MHQLRQDGDGRWLFVASGKEPYNKHISNSQKLRIRVKGAWKASLYNTMNGEIEQIQQSIKGEVTELYYTKYHYDSLLIRLEPEVLDEVKGDVKAVSKSASASLGTINPITLPNRVPYTLSEPNALLLDCAEYALDGGQWQPKEEILRLDVACRKTLGWSTDIQHVAQPWSLGEETELHTVSLRWRIDSQIEYEGAKLAIEHAEDVKLKWNGQEVDNTVNGWYVDKAIKTVDIPKIQKGENILEAEVSIGKRTTVEWAYLLGDFGVEVCGKNTCLVPKRDELSFGDVTVQGLPFYTGNITYHIPVETKGGNLQVRSGYYVGAMQEVSVDGKQAVPMIYQPYVADLGEVGAGKHIIDLTSYGTRQNGFGPLHLADAKYEYPGPKAWRTVGNEWCYEYRLREMGVIVSPEITEEI